MQVPVEQMSSTGELSWPWPQQLRASVQGVGTQCHGQGARGGGHWNACATVAWDILGEMVKKIRA